MNLDRERDLANLLDYYRVKVDNFEKERVEWINKLELLNLNLSDKHSLEWELKVRSNEILSLQNTKSEVIKSINIERQTNHKLSGELSYYKERSNQDRRRILQLLKLSDPVEQDIILSNDKKPETKEKFTLIGNNDINFNSNSISVSNQHNNKKISSKISQMQPEIQSRGRSVSSMNKTKSQSNSLLKIKPERTHIIRSVIFPNNDKAQQLNEEIVFLKEQLSDTRKFYEDLLKQQNNQSKEYEEELLSHISNLNEQMKKIFDEKKKSEELSFHLTKELMSLKMEYSHNEKKLFEELELLKLQNQALVISIKEYSTQNNNEKEICIKEIESKAKKVTEIMKSQLKNSEENMRIIREQYKQIQVIYQEKINQVESKMIELQNENNYLKQNVSQLSYYKNNSALKSSISLKNIDKSKVLEKFKAKTMAHSKEKIIK